MTDLSPINNDLKMSSKEIAELTEKEHRNVCRDIRVMLVELHGEGGVLRFEHTQTNPQNGQSYPIFNLPKRELMILLTGYSIPLRAKVVDRWNELERKAANPYAEILPKNYLEALKQLTCTLEENQALVQKTKELEKDIKIFEPKADALDLIADADGLFNLTNTAKNLQVQPKKLFDYLRQNHWIYKRAGGTGNVAYQEKIQAGYLTHKTYTATKADGTEKVCEQVMVTGKGLARLALDLNSTPLFNS